MVPFFTFPAVLQSPAGGMSTAASLLPPAAPFIMPLLLALEPGPPVWQVALSMLLTAAATLACVWAGARIFRIGIFLQGKPPGWLQIIKWVFSRWCPLRASQRIPYCGITSTPIEDGASFER